MSRNDPRLGCVGTSRSQPRASRDKTCLLNKGGKTFGLVWRFWENKDTTCTRTKDKNGNVASKMKKSKRNLPSALWRKGVRRGLTGCRYAWCASATGCEAARHCTPYSRSERPLQPGRWCWQGDRPGGWAGEVTVLSKRDKNVSLSDWLKIDKDKCRYTSWYPYSSHLPFLVKSGLVKNNCLIQRYAKIVQTEHYRKNYSLHHSHVSNQVTWIRIPDVFKPPISYSAYLKGTNSHLVVWFGCAHPLNMKQRKYKSCLSSSGRKNIDYKPISKQLRIPLTLADNIVK